MRPTLAILAFAAAIATTNVAGATYLLTPGASLEERERYDAYHTQINEFHTGWTSGAMAGEILSRARSSNSQHVHSTRPEYDVHVNGRYVGSDPDSAVRDALRRDPWTNR